MLGGSGGEVGGLGGGGRGVGVMVDDSAVELFGDKRLVGCCHLHRVLFSFRDFDL